jgi:hypothetical protein
MGSDKEKQFLSSRIQMKIVNFIQIQIQNNHPLVSAWGNSRAGPTEVNHEQMALGI